MSRTPHVLVGCELVVRRGDELLLGKRINCAGAGTWALPGGHLEPRERLVQAVCREAREELDARIDPHDVTLVSVVDVPDPGTHYIHATFELLNPAFEPQIGEPDRCAEWRYFALKDLPSNLFHAHQKIIQNYLAGQLYRPKY